MKKAKKTKPKAKRKPLLVDANVAIAHLGKELYQAIRQLDVNEHNRWEWLKAKIGAADEKVFELTHLLRKMEPWASHVGADGHLRRPAEREDIETLLVRERDAMVSHLIALRKGMEAGISDTVQGLLRQEANRLGNMLRMEFCQGLGVEPPASVRKWWMFWRRLR